jgi:hypothetical protein
MPQEPLTIKVAADKAAHLEKLSKLSLASLEIFSSKIDKYTALGKLPDLEKKISAVQNLI